MCLPQCMLGYTPPPGCGPGDPPGCGPGDLPRCGPGDPSGVGLKPPWCGPGDPPGQTLQLPPWVWAWACWDTPRETCCKACLDTTCNACWDTTPPCEQNHRHVQKHDLAPTSLRAVTRMKLTQKMTVSL